MGGFLGIGNTSAKTDRGNQLAGINASWNVYNRGLPLADTTATQGLAKTNAGFGGLQEAQAYWDKLRSGDRTAVMQAAAPAINAVEDQTTARRNQQAEIGTGRTGGATASNEEAESKKMADINNIIAGVQPTAAAQGANVATAEANVGSTQMREALQALGLDQSTADEIINSSIQSRPISEEANAKVRQMWAGALAGLEL